jgi:hypothetical protein
MAGQHLKEIPVVFYRTPTGVEPVRDWLRGLPDDGRQTIGIDLATVQAGRPECRCAALLAADYGKCAAICRAAALRGYCFSSTRDE